MANIENSITKAIFTYNPWLDNNLFRFSVENLKKREIFFDLKKQLNKNLIISLIGLRRTGKTTVLKQLINDLFSEKIERRRVFFYEFDERLTDLESVLDFYFQNILREDLYETSCYIFLDELQFVEDWQPILKRYYDINSKIKFIISGSTHLYLHKNTKESLAGRIVDFKLLPFSWFEFLNFKYSKKLNSPLQFVFDENFIELVSKNKDVLLYEKDFKNYLSHGEFPYFFHDVNSFELDKYYQNSILDKIFLKDIGFFSVENRRAFENLYRVLNYESANVFNLQNLSRELGVSSLTIKRYIEILEKMFLFKYLYKYEKSLRKQIHSFKKGYSTSLNLLRVSANFEYSNISKERFGHIIETFVYNELVKAGLQNLNFYNDTKIKKEVDFVLSSGAKVVAIEVKTSENWQKIKLTNLLYFMEKNNLRQAYVFYCGRSLASKKFHDLQIDFIPVYLI